MELGLCFGRAMDKSVTTGYSTALVICRAQDTLYSPSHALSGVDMSSQLPKSMHSVTKFSRNSSLRLHYLQQSKRMKRCSSTASFALSQNVNSFQRNELPVDLATRLEKVVDEFSCIVDPRERHIKLLSYSSIIPSFPASERILANRVMGCTAQVWLTAELGIDDRIYFAADSDSEITRGFCSCLLKAMNGALPEEVLQVKTEALSPLNIGLAGGVMSRSNTWHNILIAMQKKVREILAKRAGNKPHPFPSLVVTAEGIEAHGTFAEAQAKYLCPDASKVAELVSVLKEKQIGIVAHFYMDPEVQGVLVAAKQHWPHVHISDSLVMADRAVRMAVSGCRTILVLGVDFMSENVRAILDQAGFGKIGVYRMSSERIGCSLADAAASPQYLDFLKKATKSEPSLHVIYINTSLKTKAESHQMVPTITCTSSNVVQTVLQAFAQIPNLSVWYGPDTYMGANLAELFRQMSKMSDAEIAEVHPLHNRSTISSLLHRLRYFDDGQCIVHDIFGADIVRKVKEDYCDSYLTAHFEVPGEMFSLAIEANKRGMGVVGSTKNILDFITHRVQEAMQRGTEERLHFVLGTESGMVTSIVSNVRNALTRNIPEGANARANISVEISFPVSSDSISETGDTHSDVEGVKKLAIVPGPSSGEGCSLHGGCASCPYMKMNSLASLLHVCCLVDTPERSLLSAYEVQRFDKNMISGYSIAELGCEPILHMREFQSTGKLPQKLVHQVSRKTVN